MAANTVICCSSATWYGKEIPANPLQLRAFVSWAANTAPRVTNNTQNTSVEAEISVEGEQPAYALQIGYIIKADGTTPAKEDRYFFAYSKGKKEGAGVPERFREVTFAEFVHDGEVHKRERLEGAGVQCAVHGALYYVMLLV